MQRADPLENAQHALGDLLRRLPVTPLPALSIGEPLGDLDVRQAFPGAEVLLAQAWIDGDLEPVHVGDRARGVERARQVAREHGRQRLGGELLGQGPSLVDACRVERNVGVPLDAAPDVPVRLTVSRQQDLGHPPTVPPSSNVGGCPSCR